MASGDKNFALTKHTDGTWNYGGNGSGIDADLLDGRDSSEYTLKTDIDDKVVYYMTCGTMSVSGIPVNSVVLFQATDASCTDKNIDEGFYRIVNATESTLSAGITGKDIVKISEDATLLDGRPASDFALESDIKNKIIYFKDCGTNLLSGIPAGSVILYQKDISCDATVDEGFYRVINATDKKLSKGIADGDVVGIKNYVDLFVKNKSSYTYSGAAESAWVTIAKISSGNGNNNFVIKVENFDYLYFNWDVKKEKSNLTILTYLYENGYIKSIRVQSKTGEMYLQVNLVNSHKIDIFQLVNPGDVASDITLLDPPSTDSLEGCSILQTITLSEDITANGVIATTGNIIADTISSYNNLNVGKDALITGKIDVTGATTLGDALTVSGAATLNGITTIKGAATLDSTLDVTGAATLDSTLDVTGAATLDSTLDVTGAATLDSTLAVKDATTLGDALTVSGAATLNGITTIKGAATLDSTLDVTGAATLDSTLDVTGATTLGDALTVSGAATFNGITTIKGAATLDSTLDVKGAATLDSTLDVTGAATLDSTLDVTGAATLDSTLDVTGATTLGDALTVSGAATLNGITTIKGAATLDSTLDVTGATTLDSTLDVTGATTLDSTLDVTGAATLDSTLAVSGKITSDSKDVILSDSKQILANSDVLTYSDNTLTLKTAGTDATDSSKSVSYSVTIDSSSSTPDKQILADSSAMTFSSDVLTLKTADSSTTYTADVVGTGSSQALKDSGVLAVSGDTLTLYTADTSVYYSVTLPSSSSSSSSDCSDCVKTSSSQALASNGVLSFDTSTDKLGLLTGSGDTYSVDLSSLKSSSSSSSSGDCSDCVKKGDSQALAYNDTINNSVLSIDYSTDTLTLLTGNSGCKYTTSLKYLDTIEDISIKSAGYIEFTGNLIFEWGKLSSITINDDTNNEVLFPVHMNTAVYSITVTESYSSNMSGNTVLHVTDIDSGGFCIKGDQSSRSDSTIGDIYWFAIGVV